MVEGTATVSDALDSKDPNMGDILVPSLDSPVSDHGTTFILHRVRRLNNNQTTRPIDPKTREGTIMCLPRSDGSSGNSDRPNTASLDIPAADPGTTWKQRC